MEQIYIHYLDGMITEQEALNLFDLIQIRGAFDGPEFTGYDYRYQEWVYLTPETIN